MTSVWPALWPPWKRTTISACSDSQSTILPFPSSPHWAPTTTTLAIPGVSLCNPSLHEHDGIRKATRATSDQRPRGLPFGDHAPSPNRGLGAAACEAPHPIMEAAGRSKQEGRQEGPLEHFQALDIPGKFCALGGAWGRPAGGRSASASPGG